MAKHKEIEMCKPTTQESFCATPGSYKRRFSDTDPNKKQQNWELFANQSARTDKMQSTKQLYPDAAFACLRSLEEKQNLDKEASHLEMQVVHLMF